VVTSGTGVDKVNDKSLPVLVERIMSTPQDFL
jgi:hypothetical protein